MYQNKRKIELDLLLKKYNVKNIREIELKAANERIQEKSDNWQILIAEIEQNMNACDEIKGQHAQNLENYFLIMNALDPEAFKLKTQQSISKLRKDLEYQNSAVERLRIERDKLSVIAERLDQDVEEVNEYNQELKTQIQNGDVVSNKSKERDQADKMRQEIDDKKARMTKIAMMNIDISEDPAKAIQQISTPLLDLTEVKSAAYEEELK